VCVRACVRARARNALGTKLLRRKYDIYAKINPILHRQSMTKSSVNWQKDEISCDSKPFRTRFFKHSSPTVWNRPIVYLLIIVIVSLLNLLKNVILNHTYLIYSLHNYYT